MNLAAKKPLEVPADGRQSPTALAVARGSARLLHAHGFCVVSELPLPSGRRADLVALDAGGEIWIVEIKSSVADFRADQKWLDYRAALRPAVLRHRDRRAVRDLPARHRADRGRCVRRRSFTARRPSTGCRRRPARHDAAVRARRRAAPAVARRSARAVRGNFLISVHSRVSGNPAKMKASIGPGPSLRGDDGRTIAARVWPECAARCGGAC